MRTRMLQVTGTPSDAGLVVRVYTCTRAEELNDHQQMFRFVAAVCLRSLNDCMKIFSDQTRDHCVWSSVVFRNELGNSDCKALLIICIN